MRWTLREARRSWKSPASHQQTRRPNQALERTDSAVRTSFVLRLYIPPRRSLSLGSLGVYQTRANNFKVNKYVEPKKQRRQICQRHKKVLYSAMGSGPMARASVS